MLDLVCILLAVAYWVFIAWIVLSYVISFGRLGWDHPVRRLYDALSKVFEPILLPIRRAVPPVRLGGVALDLSPVIVLIGLYMVRVVIC